MKSSKKKLMPDRNWSLYLAVKGPLPTSLSKHLSGLKIPKRSILPANTSTQPVIISISGESADAEKLISHLQSLKLCSWWVVVWM